MLFLRRYFLSDTDSVAANAMRNGWVNFAKTEKPSGKWKPYSNNSTKLFIFDRGKQHFVVDLAKKCLDLVEKYIAQ